MTLEADQSVAVDGTPLGVTVTQAGQTERLLFAATAGENLGFGLRNLTLTGSNYGSVYVYIYKPDGSIQASLWPCAPATGGCDINLGNVATTGTYGVVVQSPGPTADANLTMSFTAAVSHDLVVALTAGTPASMNLSRNGQNGRLTFAGTAGAAAGLQITAASVVPSGKAINVTVLKPDGTTLLSSASGTGGYALALPSLPVSGTYTAFVDPQNGATANLTATLVTGDVGGGGIPMDGAAQNISSTTYNYFGFSATAGDNLGLGISNLVLTSSIYGYVIVDVYKPNGTVLATVSCQAVVGACDVNLGNVAATGFYGVVVHSPGAGANEPNLTMSFAAVVSHDLAAPLTAGTPASMSISRNGQNGRLTFNGTAGAAAGLQVTAASVVPSGRVLNVSVLKPDGTTLVSGSDLNGYATSIPSLPVSGTYTVFIDPQYGAKMDLTATLVTGDTNGGAVAVDGAAQNVSSTTNAYFGFSATAGDNIGIGISNMVLTGSAYGYVTVSVYKPNGSLLTSVNCFTTTNACDLNLANLSTTGLYGVVVKSPSSASEANLTISFAATVSHDLAASLTAGTPVSVSISRNGQNGRLTFSGTAGAAAGLQITASSVVPSGRVLNVSVLKPDGTTLVSGSDLNGYAMSIPSLPVSGTYTVFIDPQYGAKTDLTVTLVTGDTNGGAVPVDGAAQNVSSTTYAYFGFSATAGDNVGVGIGSLVLTNSVYGYVTVNVYKPNGALLTNLSCFATAGACDLNLANLSTTGLYGVVVRSPNPAAEANLAMSFAATVSHDLATPLTAGTPASVSISRNGQNGRLTFSGTAGAAAGLQITASSVVPSGRTLSVSVLKPDGTTLVSGVDLGGYALAIPSFPVSGTYTVFVDPQNGAKANFTATLVTGDSGGGAVPVDGAAQSVSSTTYAYFGFSATAGDNIGVGISSVALTGSSYGYVSVSVYKPNGALLAYGTNCVATIGSCDFNLGNLPNTGLYGVVVRSPNPLAEPNVTMNFTATVSHDLVVPLTAGTPSSVNLSRYGQNGRLTFSGTAAANASVQISGISTTPSGKTVNLSVLKPDGTTLSSTSSLGSYTFNLTNLPTTGTYTVLIDPQNGVIANMQVTQQ